MAALPKKLKRKKADAAETAKDSLKQETTNGKGHGPVWVDGELYFSPLDLARYQLAEHKLANTLQGVQLKKHEIEAENLRHNSEMRRVQLEIANLTNVTTAHKAELVALREELQQHYPVNFNEITFDDVTGKIMIHGTSVNKE